MAVVRAFHVLAAACAVAGSALLGGAAFADARPPCPSCVADPAPPPYDSGDAWYPLTVPGQRSETSADPADSADPVAGTGSAAAGSAAAGSAGLGVVLGSGSAGLGVVLGSGSAGLALALGSGSAGLGVALGTGSAAVGSAAAGTGSAVMGTGSAALGTGSAVVGTTGSAVVGGTGSAAVGSAGIGSAAVGSAATGSAATGSAAVGSAAVGSASPLLLLLIPLPQATVPPAPALPPVTVPPVPAPPPVTVPPVPAPAAPWSSPIPIDAPLIPPFAASAPDLAARAPLREQPVSPAVRTVSGADLLPAPRLLPVIGGLIALALAGVGSGVISFHSAAAAQARIDAARAQFFPRP
ncbi:hypothetical protein [Nocardia abscessus]|uniref:hypothetical protein n=1 Tax=Nocardia abscessus TaxID=120957 RepID=UPI002454A765|nr:hypothetical protein [Nocardia abscessus]